MLTIFFKVNYLCLKSIVFSVKKSYVHLQVFFWSFPFLIFWKGVPFLLNMKTKSILVWHSAYGICARLSNPAQLIILLFCLLPYDTRMLIQRIQKRWIENPRLLMCLKTIQCNAVRSVWIFQSTIFEVIGLPQCKIKQKSIYVQNKVFGKIYVHSVGFASLCFTSVVMLKID